MGLSPSLMDLDQGKTILFHLLAAVQASKIKGKEGAGNVFTNIILQMRN